MNIFKFHISIDVKDKTNSNPICEQITNIYSSKSSKFKTYKEYVIQKWESIKKDNISAIYPAHSLLTYVNKSKCTYFIVDSYPNDAIDQVTVEVFVLSELNNINDAFNIVYKDLQKKMKKTLKISLIDNQALLYIYDGKDIIATHVMIKADVVSYSKFSKAEIARSCFFGVFALVFFVAPIYSNKAEFNNIMYSLGASCIFFIISEFMIKISINKIVEIKSFTIKTEEREYNFANENTKLENPKF